MSLMERMKKNSKIKEASVLEESTFFNNKDETPTIIPNLNIALSGSLYGGLQPGLLQVAGPSKHFKSSISLVIAAAYLNKHPDAILMFYDSEFGSPKSYFKAYGIDPARVLHNPLTDIEQLKFDIMNQVKELKRGDKVLFLIDSIGNLASKKEVEDALSEKSVADMTRAKQLKSLFRMITPHLVIKDMSLIAINHVYMEMGCLAGETKIKTLNGLKQIKDVVAGDIVYTVEGSQRVNHVFGPEDIPKEGKRYLKITLEDGSEISCTANHKFLTSEKEWVEAGNLVLGEEMF